MTETQLLQEIRLALAKIPGIVLFRNNVGACLDKSNRLVRFGVGGKGGSDLIGWVVHNKLAIFLAIEVKLPGKNATNDQINFMDAVLASGGLAGVARSVQDAIDIVSIR